MRLMDEMLCDEIERIHNKLMDKDGFTLRITAAAGKNLVTNYAYETILRRKRKLAGAKQGNVWKAYLRGQQLGPSNLGAIEFAKICKTKRSAISQRQPKNRSRK